MAIGPDGLTVHLPLVIVYDVQRDDVAAKHKPSASPVYTERDTVTLGRFVAYYGASSMCMCVFLDDWRPLLHPSPQNGRMVDRSVGLDLHSEAVTRPGRWALPKFANFFFSSNASALVWHRLPDELFFFCDISGFTVPHQLVHPSYCWIIGEFIKLIVARTTVCRDFRRLLYMNREHSYHYLKSLHTNQEKSIF